MLVLAAIVSAAKSATLVSCFANSLSRRRDDPPAREEGVAPMLARDELAGAGRRGRAEWVRGAATRRGRASAAGRARAGHAHDQAYLGDSVYIDVEHGMLKPLRCAASASLL